jgi:acetolactate synthase regulatory subunit
LFFIPVETKNKKIWEVNMCRTISFRVSKGMDSAVRVLTTLRRKQFDVKEFSMSSLDENNSVFKITLEDEKRNSFDRAILQMQKIVDVYDVSECLQ